jgi:putative ABC transport system ATP-binding protein
VEILKCVGLTKVYGTGDSKVIALDHVNLSIEKGEFAAVVGASGSGKSTFLHMLGGVDQPTEGNVFVEDKDLSTLNPTSSAIFRRRKVGLIYQFYNLIPTLTVERNIMMPMFLDKKKPDKEFFDQIVIALGIKDKLNALPSQLSGGQQQRTAIARSLLYRPALLLADEPTGNLDQKNSREIIELIKMSNKEFKQTIIMITHEERLTLEADRIITFEDGRIISDVSRRG